MLATHSLTFSMRFFLLAFIGLTASVIGVPTTKYVIHEKRDQPPPGWVKYGPLPGARVFSLRIALPQENLDNAERFLMDVSRPESTTYGQHWPAAKIADTFAPSPASVEAVSQWLHSSGVSPERISRSQSLGWLSFNLTIDEAEKLLKTKYYLYKHFTGKTQMACAQYLVPEHISTYLDFIIPTVNFDFPVTNLSPYSKEVPPVDLHHATARVPIETHATADVESPNMDSRPSKGVDVGATEIPNALLFCNNFLTLDCIRALYNFGPGTSANPENSLGVVEFSPRVYVQEDLDLFFASTDQVQTTPILNAINGAALESSEKSFELNAESDADLEVAMGLVNPQKVTLYQVGDRPEGSTINDFLDALDESYCTFRGGDDRSQPTSSPNASVSDPGSDYCGIFPATKVISISYSINEAYLSSKYATRQCIEYLKLGLAGTTVLWASGDSGVAGLYGRCIDTSNSTSRYTNGTDGAFSPQFPASCPYVTAVGATQIRSNGTILDEEVACETVIYSGGGFSNLFRLPDYQTTAVKSYFSNHPPPYGADRFNNSTETRGIPDISANGANHALVVNGQYTLNYGTSLAVPVVASIFTLINEVRINLGRSSVGFVNPVLYANPHALNDITSGKNPGCGTSGFEAAEGWDPVTGLGTPRFPELLEIFLALQ